MQAEVLKRGDWRETGVGIKMRGCPTADVFASGTPQSVGSMRTGPPAHIGCGRHVKNVEEVPDAEHAIYRLALVGWRYVTGLHHSALHEKQFIIFMHNMFYGYNQWTVIFCRWLLHRIADESEFLCRVLCTDEWSKQPPRPTWMDTRKSLCYLTLVFSFNVNVWVRLVDNYSIGPHVVVDRMGGRQCTDSR